MATRRLATRRRANRRSRLSRAQRPAAALPHRRHPGSRRGRGPGPRCLRTTDHRGPRRPRPRRHRRLAPSRRAQPRDEPGSQDHRRRSPAVRARRLRLGAVTGEPDRCRRRAAGRGHGTRRTRSRRPRGPHPGGAGLPRRRDRPVDRESDLATRTLLCRARAKVRRPMLASQPGSARDARATRRRRVHRYHPGRSARRSRSGNAHRARRRGGAP